MSKENTVNPEIVTAQEPEVQIQHEMVSLDDTGTTSVTNLKRAKVGMSIYTSIPLETPDGKLKVFNALNGDTQPLKSQINKPVTIRDVVSHMVQIVDENTGELRHCPRIIIITPDGKQYSAVSDGVVNSFEKLINVFGHPASWTEDIKVNVYEKETRNGNNRVLLFEVSGFSPR